MLSDARSEGVKSTYNSSLFRQFLAVLKIHKHFFFSKILVGSLKLVCIAFFDFESN